MTIEKAGRNDPCPCGSGKKYKQCCLKKEGEQPASANPATGDIAHALQTAIGHHQAGRLSEAEALYRQILQVETNHPDALHLLGLIASQVGKHEIAVDLISKAINAKPQESVFYNSLGNEFHTLGRLNEAVANYRFAARIKPDYMEVHINLGTLLHERGQLDEAISSYQQVLSFKPDYVEVLFNLGVAFQAQGRLDEAIASYRRALRIKPDYAEAHLNLGMVLKEQGKLDEAVASYRQSLNIKPDYAEAYCNLGSALKEQGKLDEAVASCQQALRVRPDFAEAHYNLGLALQAMGRLSDAIASYQQSLGIKSGFAEAHYNLGLAFQAQGKLEEAIYSCQQAIRIRPDYAEAHHNLGVALQALGRLDEAAASYRQALLIRPDYAEAHSGLLMVMQYMPDLTPDEVFVEHTRYAEQHELPLRAYWQMHRNNRDSERRLKIGYVSGDFRNHSVAYFIEPVLANHDKSQVEVYCYYNFFLHDSYTDRIAADADHWLVCAGMSDEQLAEHIRADGIDILIDLSGHTAYNRLPVFARKPAPVQATWIGYAGTTGLTAMDYRISDAYLDPPGQTERYHSETLLRLPATGYTYKPEPGCPEVNLLPALSSGKLVFASLNNPIKINQAVVNLWGKILVALPHARLMLGNATGNETRHRLIEMFGKAGIGTERLILQPRMSMMDYLALHQQIDIALDPFPYNGGTTTLHSLWMGVPVITLVGGHMVSLVGGAMLSRVGMSEFVTHSEEEYLQRAIQLAQELPSLNRIRQSLRARINAGDFEPEKITRNLEMAYREVWRKWCAT